MKNKCFVIQKKNLYLSLLFDQGIFLWASDKTDESTQNEV